MYFRFVDVLFLDQQYFRFRRRAFILMTILYFKLYFIDVLFIVYYFFKMSAKHYIK